MSEPLEKIPSIISFVGMEFATFKLKDGIFEIKIHKSAKDMEQV